MEIDSVDTVGVHYSGTLWRWYRNWLGNIHTINAKYGQRWFRVSAVLNVKFVLV
jgi:cyclopropane-fatty-acyl-phospholipid synthase